MTIWRQNGPNFESLKKRGFFNFQIVKSQKILEKTYKVIRFWNQREISRGLWFSGNFNFLKHYTAESNREFFKSKFEKSAIMKHPTLNVTIQAYENKKVTSMPYR